MPPTRRQSNRPRPVRLALLLLTGLSLGFVPTASMGFEALELDSKVECQDGQELIAEPRVEISERRHRSSLKQPLCRHAIRRYCTTHLAAQSGHRICNGLLAPLRL